MTVQISQKTAIKTKHQTTLSIDKETKQLAAIKASQQQMSVSAVARILLRDYASGRLEIGTRIKRDENGFTKKATAKLDKIIKDSKDPKNLSPMFDDIDEAIAYLHQ